MFVYNQPHNCVGHKNGIEFVVKGGNVEYKLNAEKSIWLASYIYNKETEEYVFVPVLCQKFNPTNEGFAMAMKTAEAHEHLWQNAQTTQHAHFNERNMGFASHEIVAIIFAGCLYDKIAGCELATGQEAHDLVMAACVAND